MISSIRKIIVTLGVIVMASLAMIGTASTAWAANTVLGGGGQINTCAQISSPNGQAVLRMQCDGNLVLIHPGNRAVWSSKTAGQPEAVARMQTDGNLVVYSRGNIARWASGTGGNRNAVLALQDDGNLVIIAEGNRPVWSTNTRISTPPTGGSSLTARVVDLTNAERARVGCGALRVDGGLTTAAQNFAADMGARNYFSHTSPSPAPRSLGDRLAAANVSYSRAGENIGSGAANDADTIVRAWMNSSGHRATIVNCSYTRIGVGYDGRSGARWAQLFAR